MAQKNAKPSAEQGKVLKQHGLSPLFWVVVKEFNSRMIVRNRFTGKIKLIGKD